MDSESRKILELVQANKISAQEGSRQLREAADAALLPGHAGGRALVSNPENEASHTEPPTSRHKVAIIGLACRFAGAQSAGQFWQNLAKGECSIREVPSNRWDVKQYYDPDPRVLGKTNCRWGGFIDDVDAFDPLFFNMSGREAELTDPQQRLFLEVCWSAFEDAGYVGDAVSGLNCGVYAGAPASDYSTGAELDAQALMGGDTAILAARISYFLNLRGPSIAINTACSSSLVALHLACQAIESGQCEMALAGGVCLFVNPTFYISATKAGMLSPDGVCKTFDEGANGFVPGEGAGAVVLKRYEAALRDRDHIYGVVLAAETNQDGKTNGITAPSSRSQTAVQISAYRKAGISPETISLIEAHGTGTKLGDPIEVEALTRSFAEYTDRKQFCAIGSVKTNIGHTGQAAGMAGLIKVLLAFQHEQIPSTLQFQKENQCIRFVETPFIVAASAMPWPKENGLLRRAAVSSFGYSGTNAHVVIEEPPPREAGMGDRAPRLILVSAKTDVALTQLLENLSAWLEGEGRNCRLADIAYTLHAGRKHFAERVAFVACDLDEMHRAVQTARAGTRMERVRLSLSEKQQCAERLRHESFAGDLTGEGGREELEQAAGLYMRGLDIQSDLLYAGGEACRIPLPTYPFSRERYWVRQNAAALPAANATTADCGGVCRHPFLSEDLSTSAGHRYAFRPVGSEFFVADHIIDGESILAAAVSLEMARAAGELIRPGITSLREVTWRRPLPGRAESGLEIRLRPEGSNFLFEIDVAQPSHQSPSVTGILCDGQVSEDSAVIDLVAVRLRCLRSLSGDECYERFRTLGFEYGPGFQVIRELRFNDAEVLTRLELPEALVAGLHEFVLHPALLDGAIQSMIVLHGGKARSDERFVPYALGEADIHAPLPRACYAYLTRNHDTELDISLTDEAGRVLLAIRRLTVARVAPAAQLMRYRSVWQQSPLREGARTPGPTLILCDVETESQLRAQNPMGIVTVGVPGQNFQRTGPRDYVVNIDSAQDFARLFESLSPDEKPRRVLICLGMPHASTLPEAIPDLARSFYLLLYISQALMKSRRNGPLTIGFIYPMQGEFAPSHLTALGAFARTLRLEQPDLRLQIVGLPADAMGLADVAGHWEELFAEEASADAIEVRFHNDGTRWVRVLQELPRGDRPPSTLLREGGVYLITGGAGGLGLVLARYLARKKATIVFVGRSALTGDQEAELTRISGTGVSVVYKRADVADRAALEQAIQSVRSQFGSINGIIHAAGVLRDSFILQKTNSAAHEVIAPKLEGAIWLDWITRADRLDFMVFFSSAVSVMGNIGQADYAFANAFLDEFAAAREVLRHEGKRWGKTVSINWPEWAAGGMRGAPDATKRRAHAGIAVLGEKEGLQAFEEALALEGGSQLIILKGDPALIRKLVVRLDEAHIADASVGSVQNDRLLPRAETYLKEILAEELRIPVARIQVNEPLEVYGIDSVMVMRLTSRLEVDFGELPKTLFFEYQNLKDLAGYFVERHGQRLASKIGVDTKSEPDATTPAQDVPTAEVTSIIAPSRAPQPVGNISNKYDDAIAIIGMSGRYPMADDLDAFWRNLAQGRDCITEIPPDRWALEGFYSPEKGKSGRSYTKWGGFLDDIDKFDPLFFNIAPKESDMMDPQERLFLETVWHVLEDAGCTRRALNETRVGVFVGVMYGQYQMVATDDTDGRLGVSSYASIANRVSYYFNFRGPSLALDTMCSSSLTAIHLACESLRRNECDAAITGGVNVSIHPHKYLQLSLGGFASSDGRCRSFGEGGDGYVPGEGVGALLLKPLAAALADGDTIQGLIRGSAINHGGKTNGYTVPNPRAQSEVIIEALQKARVDARHVSYIEAHGTGTALGDPIEIAALTKAYSEFTRQKHSCPIGSVKSVIGHLESAAGIAAVTKVLLQMRHAALAPSLHAEKLNPNIDFASSPFYVNTKMCEWKRPTIQEGHYQRPLPRIAGVSSFGAGGANAHILLEEYEADSTGVPDGEPQLIAISAKTSERLAAVADLLANHLEAQLRPLRLPWRTRLYDDVLRRICGLVGVRIGDIGSDDNLQECGLDEVRRAQFGTIIGRAYGFACEDDSTCNTLASLVEFLSTRYEAQLRVCFGDDEPAAPKLPVEPRLTDISFTLQVGREVMDERLAFVASNFSEVVHCLRNFTNKETQGTDLFFGRVPADDGDSANAVFAGDAGQEYLRTLVRERNLARIAELWAQGAIVDWMLLHAGRNRRRISLPGYPFAREPHWLPVARSSANFNIVEMPHSNVAAITELPIAITQGREENMNTMKQQPSANGIDSAEIRTQLARDLISLAAGIIGLAPERMDPKVNLGDYGFESMGLKNLAEQISSRFGIAFSPAQFFERASLEGVAEWLFEEHEVRVVAFYQPPAKTVPVSASVPLPIADQANQDQPILNDHDSTVSREPIAIIGLSGRFPGSKNFAQFWENLRAERDLVAEIPHDRWDWHDYDHDGLPPSERCKFHWGGFIDDADKFDPLFFGISPAEAEMMDPQQRTFLEAVWAAIEDAGYRASDLSGKNVGLFAGIQFSDYQHLLHEAGILTAQSALGNEHSIVLNRISYLLNLKGPSEPVNTACSSSLVAVHRAVRSVRSGESVIAIAGGIALNLSPHSTVAAGKMGLLAPDGKCKTLDRSANGYVKGEGIGVVVLKPLGQALADGDHIHAVIRGTAVNHGGRAASLTAPNSEAQAALIQAAVEEAEIGSETVGYIELHGTGTELGDPVEINGIKSAFRKIAKKRGAPPIQRPHCALGSVKTNIGHLEPASGIAGMIKVILAMQNETLPGLVHLKQLNPYIDLKDSPFFLAEKTQRWERLTDPNGQLLPFRAGVSSFGFGGVNAHVLLEEYRSAIRPLPAAGHEQLFVFSGKTNEALQQITKEFLGRVEVWEQTNTAPSLDDVAYTLQVGREEMKERLACVVADVGELRKILEGLVADEPGDKRVYRGQAISKGEAFFTQDLHVLAKRWANGGVVDWNLLQRSREPRRVSLPTYPFARKRYWFTVPEGSVPLRKPEATSEDREAMAPINDDEILSDEDLVRSELREILAEKLKLSEDELDEDTNLQDFGVDSMLGAMILQAIQEKFGSQVPLTAVTDYPTLRLLSKYIHDEFAPGQGSVSETPNRPRKKLAEKAAAVASAKPSPKQVKLPPELLPINMKGSQQTSFWVHGAAGYSSWFQNLSEALGPEYPIYAFQARGSDGHSVPQMLDEMVDHYVHCVRLVQPKGPYVIGGYSFGGVVAIEMARRLQAEGETIRHLIMFDTYPSTQEVFDRHFAGYGYEDNFLEFYLANYYLKVHQHPELAIRPVDVAHLPVRLQLAELAKICQQRGNKRISADDIYMYLRGGLTCSAHAEGIYQMYKMRPYDGSDVLFFKATDGFTGRSSAMYWKPTNILKGYDYPQEWRERVKGNFREIALDNDHLNMLEEPTLTIACREIEAVLKQPPSLDMDQYHRFRGAFTEVTRFGHELLADRLRRSGALPGIHETFSREELHEKLRVLPQYDRLFHASLDILEREEYTHREGGHIIATTKLHEALFPEGEADVAARANVLAALYPEIKDYIPLLTTCQAACLEVMNGSRDSTDVIFPGGSMALVAELYKGNLQTGFYNRLVAERVQEYVRHHVRRYKHSKVQLFEVGAGTGGTSAFVFDALKDQAQKLRYLYTDIGPAFVQMAKRQFAGQYPFVDFIAFDVEQPPEAQGFEPETMDVVIASNVLHTTRRIAVTLQQCQRMLKPDGILIVNELTQRLDYNTLTFGLTTGWWLYEDDQERIQGTPLLRPADWREMLQNAGFGAVEVHGVPDASEADQAQCMIVATKRAGFPNVISPRTADMGIGIVDTDPHAIALSDDQSCCHGDQKEKDSVTLTDAPVYPDVVVAN